MRAIILSGLLVVTMVPALESHQPARSTFVTLSGADTVQVEQFTRTATSITGDIRFVKQQSTLHYSIVLHTDGTTEQSDVTDDDAQGKVVSSLFFGTDSIRASGTTNGRPWSGSLVTTGKTYAHIGLSYALMEQLVRATHPAVGDSVRVSIINIRQNLPGSPITIKRISADSVQVGANFRVGLSRSGDVTGGINTQSNAVTTRR